MKKGAKLKEDGFLVEISDLDNNYCSAPLTTNSLRQAVSYAAEVVPGMDNYLKVYRDFTAMKGAYVAVFVRSFDDAPDEHTIVKIRSFEVYTEEGLQHVLDYLERISKDEVKPRRKRSSSR